MKEKPPKYLEGQLKTVERRARAGRLRELYIALERGKNPPGLTDSEAASLHQEVATQIKQFGHVPGTVSVNLKAHQALRLTEASNEWLTDQVAMFEHAEQLQEVKGMTLPQVWDHIVDRSDKLGISTHYAHFESFRASFYKWRSPRPDGSKQ